MSCSASPVPAGTGWPGDPADAATPVARSAFDVDRLAGRAQSVAELDACISVCRACPRLVSWRESVATEGKRASFADQPYWGRPGPGFGDDAPKVLVVGLAPAANGTNRTGRMFTGDRSGDWLYAALHRAGYASQPQSWAAGDGLRLTGVRIVAAVRCAPPANKPSPAERSTCGAWLDRDLALAAPSLRSILALGAFGWGAALASADRLRWAAPRPRPRFAHGAEVMLIASDDRPIRLVASYHVSQQNTFTGQLDRAHARPGDCQVVTGGRLHRHERPDHRRDRARGGPAGHRRRGHRCARRARGNLEDSTMTLLRGHFAMVVLVRTGADATRSRQRCGRSRPVVLAVDVGHRRSPSQQATGTGYTLQVHGADRPGIVATMTGVVARHGGNIVDLGTRLGEDLYILTAEFLSPTPQACRRWSRTWRGRRRARRGGSPCAGRR